MKASDAENLGSEVRLFFKQYFLSLRSLLSPPGRQGQGRAARHQPLKSAASLTLLLSLLKDSQHGETCCCYLYGGSTSKVGLTFTTFASSISTTTALPGAPVRPGRRRFLSFLLRHHYYKRLTSDKQSSFLNLVHFRKKVW